jgi:hypothetical protein
MSSRSFAVRIDQEPQDVLSGRTGNSRGRATRMSWPLSVENRTINDMVTGIAQGHAQAVQRPL